MLPYYKKFTQDRVRQAHKESGAYEETLAAAETVPGSGIYECAMCGAYCSKNHKKLVVDHIDPIIDEEMGPLDFNTYVLRAFGPCQVLCFGCSMKKTNNENAVRDTTYRKAAAPSTGQKQITKDTMEAISGCAKRKGLTAVELIEMVLKSYIECQ